MILKLLLFADKNIPNYSKCCEKGFDMPFWLGLLFFNYQTLLSNN